MDEEYHPIFWKAKSRGKKKATYLAEKIKFYVFKEGVINEKQADYVTEILKDPEIEGMCGEWTKQRIIY